MVDVEIEDGPDGRQAAGFAVEPWLIAVLLVVASLVFPAAQS